ncbi:hypothetical protein DSM25_14785 [Enterococcus faecalis]|uniref:hypothetical protein n=1 Tax=Enterococcus faecalis TaxID=1351 RepID=UPI00046C7862|nr:hypothetical protein [Enterococcus faecalis]EGO9796928.1 hypothetical protein [Enterococcus faecalis]OFR18658.1 hypothetical protein HMPREF2901_05465 [Enterococcus sp. HMSC073E09]PNL03234.1 hypothetical protein CEQ25_000350 [Enterococcus faecalis]
MVLIIIFGGCVLAKKSKDLINIGSFVCCQSVMGQMLKGKVKVISQYTVIVFDGEFRHVVAKKQLKELGYFFPNKRKK